ncbi:MAG: hypothetical protein FJ137_07190 [Deltaproteobacteria bacterium]|nr:hypothetical protein [Deltaproteobacteria bacterium]
MTGDGPSSPANALIVSSEQALHGLKTSFDELDDDDLLALGRMWTSVTPRQAASGLGTVIGVGAGIALAPVTTIGAGAIVIGITAFSFFLGRRDVRANLVDQGLAPVLVETVFRATADQRRRALYRSGMVWRPFPRDEDYARFGRALVDEIEAERKQR